MPTYRLAYDSSPPMRPRRLAAFIALSLLIHALLFLSVLQHQPDMRPVESTPSAPMSVRLVQPERPAAQAAPPQEQAQPTPPPVARARPERPRLRPKIARRAPAAPAPVEPAPSSPPEPQPAPPEMDMMAMINARRAQRQAVEQEAAALNAQAAAESRGMSPNEVAMANINRDLQRRTGQRDATGGLFRIVSKGPRMATYQFRGWMPSTNARWQQTIEVDAGPGGDVDLAIVRSMIALIRKHHDGDFSWESHRLGRVVTLSARPQDTAQLEAFLMKEFFGA